MFLKHDQLHFEQKEKTPIIHGDACISRHGSTTVRNSIAIVNTWERNEIVEQPISIYLGLTIYNPSCWFWIGNMIFLNICPKQEAFEKYPNVLRCTQQNYQCWLQFECTKLLFLLRNTAVPQGTEWHSSLWMLDISLDLWPARVTTCWPFGFAWNTHQSLDNFPLLKPLLFYIWPKTAQNLEYWHGWLFDIPHL